MPSVNRVQVNATATVVVAVGTKRLTPKRQVQVINRHTASIWLNTIAGVTQANGLEVVTGGTSPVFALDWNEGLWGISAAQTAVGAVHVAVTDEQGA